MVPVLVYDKIERRVVCVFPSLESAARFAHRTPHGIRCSMRKRTSRGRFGFCRPGEFDPDAPERLYEPVGAVLLDGPVLECGPTFTGVADAARKFDVVDNTVSRWISRGAVVAWRGRRCRLVKLPAGVRTPLWLKIKEMERKES